MQGFMTCWTPQVLQLIGWNNLSMVLVCLFMYPSLAQEPIVTYDYKDIVNYSPSLKNLMIVTESLTRGTKFVFNTSQVC